MVSELPQPENKHQSAVEAFTSGLTDAVASPFNGAAELMGGPKSSRHANSDSQENSTAHGAGEMLGSALVFIATTAAVKRFLPGAGRFAPIVTGGVLGGLSETPNGTLGERLTNAALGAGTVSLLEFAPGGLNRLGVTNKLGQLAVANSAAGMFNTQAESFLKTGHAASFGDTMMGVGTWTATGMAFAGGGKVFESVLSKPATAAANGADQYHSQFAEIPGLKIGVPASPTSKIEVARGSELFHQYTQAQKGVGRAEVLAYNEQGGMEGRHGTVFSVDNKGRLVTANHVSEGAVDISVFDRNGQVHKADVITSNGVADISILQLKDPHSFGAFEPLRIDSATEFAPKQNVTTFGHPSGWRNLFATPGNTSNSFRPNMRWNLQMQGTEGLSGAPVIGEDGVRAVFVQGARSSPYETMGSSIKHAEDLITRADRMQLRSANDANFEQPRSQPLNLQLIRSFDIQNKAAATANLEKIFGGNFTNERAADFFHSKVKTVDMPGSESSRLTMSMQYRPGENKVVISPIAIDSAQIPAHEVWPGSKLGVSNSRLEVLLGADGTPLRMVSYDDPTNVLQKGFNYRGEDNYLATLQQRRFPKWMQLLPPALRFERLAVGS